MKDEAITLCDYARLLLVVQQVHKEVLNIVICSI